MKELIFYLYSASIMLAVACTGCTKTISQQGRSEVGLPLTVFDPLSLPFLDKEGEPWLDPMVFHSDNAYVVNAQVGTSKNLRSEASFIGGKDAMVAYLKNTMMDHVAKDIGWLKPPVVRFAVNDQGIADNVGLVSTSGNLRLDHRLVSLIRDMPKWEPAINADGKAVSQAFEFSVVQAGCDKKAEKIPMQGLSMYYSPLIDSTIAMDYPYDLSFDLEQIDETHYKLITRVKLHGGSFYVSPFSSGDFKGKFTIETAPTNDLLINDDFIETPRSKEVFDPHQFVNGPVNWVSVDTKYEHIFTVVGKTDFDIGGKIFFTIEPRCSLEVIPLLFKHKDGVLTVERMGC